MWIMLHVSIYSHHCSLDSKMKVVPSVSPQLSNTTLVFTLTDERKSMVNWKHVTNMGGRNMLPGYGVLPLTTASWNKIKSLK